MKPELLRNIRPIPAVPSEPQRTPEQEWLDSAATIAIEMAQAPTWRRRAELLEDAKAAMHRYFGKRSGNRKAELDEVLNG